MHPASLYVLRARLITSPFHHTHIVLHLAPEGFREYWSDCVVSTTILSGLITVISINPPVTDQQRDSSMGASNEPPMVHYRPFDGRLFRLTLGKKGSCQAAIGIT